MTNIISDFNTVFKGKERVISRRSTNLAGRYTVHNRAVEIFNLREPLVGSVVFFFILAIQSYFKNIAKGTTDPRIEFSLPK